MLQDTTPAQAPASSPDLDPAATQAPAAAPIDPAVGVPDAEAFQQFGFIEAMSHAHWVNWLMLTILVIMSIGSWYLFIVKVVKNSVIRSRADKVTRAFWETPNAADSIRFMEEQPANEPFSKVALDAAQAAAHHQRSEGSRLTETMSRSEFIDRALRQAVTRESSKLEFGQTFLASTGATAPFIGLLGTVWGILMALISIGQTGDSSIAAVAGPVGEALYMTAIGLGVAIPAVFFFNFFTRQNYEINAKLDEFAHDLHDFFATGSRMGGEVAAPAKPAPIKP